MKLEIYANRALAILDEQQAKRFGLDGATTLVRVLSPHPESPNGFRPRWVHETDHSRETNVSDRDVIMHVHDLEQLCDFLEFEGTDPCIDEVTLPTWGPDWATSAEGVLAWDPTRALVADPWRLVERHLLEFADLYNRLTHATRSEILAAAQELRDMGRLLAAKSLVRALVRPTSWQYEQLAKLAQARDARLSELARAAECTVVELEQLVSSGKLELQALDQFAILLGIELTALIEHLSRASA